jgi:hypothetical protein
MQSGDALDDRLVVSRARHATAHAAALDDRQIGRAELGPSRVVLSRMQSTCKIRSVEKQYRFGYVYGERELLKAQP